MTEELPARDVREQHVETVGVLVTPQQVHYEGMPDLSDQKKEMIQAKYRVTSPQYLLLVDDVLHLLQFDDLGHGQDLQGVVVFWGFILDQETGGESLQPSLTAHLTQTDPGKSSRPDYSEHLKSFQGETLATLGQYLVFKLFVFHSENVKYFSFDIIENCVCFKMYFQFGLNALKVLSKVSMNSFLECKDCILWEKWMKYL